MSIEPKKRMDDFEYKLMRFKKQSSGTVSEFKKRRHYDSPSVKRKKKSEFARKIKSKNKSTF